MADPKDSKTGSVAVSEWASDSNHLASSQTHFVRYTGHAGGRHDMEADGEWSRNQGIYLNDFWELMAEREGLALLCP